jgi:glycosyltransferase involved in cell wall biosynthesis
MILMSVIIPCFNAQKWVRETLASVYNQGIKDIETILIDDGSTDESAQIVKKEFPSVQLIQIKNSGPSCARNLGTQMAQGEFIQYLDADDLLAPHKLHTQLHKLQASGSDIAYGNWQKLIETKENLFQLGTLVTPYLKDPEIDLFTGSFWCPPAAYLFRRSIVEKVGRWREDYPIIQDARFMFDCALKGARFVACGGLMAYYRIHSAQSVSRKDPSAFNRDCLKNAVETELWWKDQSKFDERRQKALVEVYGTIARASFEKDKALFQIAHQTLQRLEPGYVPHRPLLLKLLSRVCGYENAESLAVRYRRIKKFILGMCRP